MNRIASLFKLLVGCVVSAFHSNQHLSEHKRQVHKMIGRICGESDREATIDEQMGMLWESNPFRSVEQHVQSFITNGPRKIFVEYQPQNNGGIDRNVEKLNDVFSAFYRGSTWIPDTNLTHCDRRRKISYAMVLAYDGSKFCGWQRQQSVLPSVQASVEDTFCKVLGETRIDVRVAGRTDLGVSAVGQIGRVRVREPLLPKHLIQINEEAVHWRLRSILQVPSTFHPTFGATSRSYVYLIDGASILRHLLVSDPDQCSLPGLVVHMNKILRSMEDRHLDCYALSSKKVLTENTLCHIFHARARLVRHVDPSRATLSPNECDPIVLAIELCANRFLRRMVRIIVSTALRQAVSACLHKQCHHIGEEYMATLLEHRDRSLSAKAAPATGLVFVGASYSS